MIICGDTFIYEIKITVNPYSIFFYATKRLVVKQEEIYHDAIGEEGRAKENSRREENENIMEKVAESDIGRKLELSGMRKSAESDIIENLELSKIINCDIR